MGLKYFTDISNLVKEKNHIKFYEHAFVPSAQHYDRETAIQDYSEYCLHNDIKINTADKKVLEFIDKKEYVYIVLENAIFHFFCDSLSAILYHYRYNKEAKFILNTAIIKGDQYAVQLMELLERFLNYLKIDYCLVDTNDSCLILKNVYFYFGLPPMQITLLDLTKTLRNIYEIDSFVVPNKKIYISRKYVDTNENTNKNFENNLKMYDNKYSQFVTDIRLENAEKFENFLIDNSFYITMFESLTWEQRFNLLNETKLISGVTGAGLLGQLFMQEGQTVVEYKTMLRGWPNFGNSHLHQQYDDMAYAKKHLYVSIYNDRNAHNLIKTIKNNKTLMALINE